MTDNCSSNKQQLLLLGARVPFPLISGERLKNFNLIQLLSKHFDLHLIFISETKDISEAKAALSPYSKTLQFCHIPIWKKLLHVFAGLFTSQPLQVAYFYDLEVQKSVDRLLPEVQVAIATLVRTARYLRDASVPKILDMADSIGLNYQRSVGATSSWAWKLIYGMESDRLIVFEKDCIQSFDRTLLFNTDEMAFFNVPDRLRWIPHGTSEALLQRSLAPTDKKWVGFLGKMDYQPNVDAVVWFAREVMPRLPNDVDFQIVGVSPNQAVLNLAQTDPRIHVTGFLEDPYSILGRCGAMVAPMQTGGGIQNKVLEAMAIGLPVVATERAARPLEGAVPGRHLLVADEPAVMAQSILSLLDSPNTRLDIGRAARHFIQENFTWEIYETKILAAIQEAIDAHSR